MKIKVDKKGQEAIQQLCDIALKSGGIQNLNGINTILVSMELLPEKDKKTDKKEVKKDK